MREAEVFAFIVKYGAVSCLPELYEADLLANRTPEQPTLV